MMQSENYAGPPGAAIPHPRPEAADADTDTNAGEERSAWRSHRLRFIALAAVIGLAVAYMVIVNFSGSTQYFVTVSEFLDDPALQDGQTLRVAGALAPDTFRREDGFVLSRFALGDKTPDMPGIAEGSPRLPATYHGVLPDLFFNPHSEIILEGRYDAGSGVFATDNVLVKCPSKYQSLQAENPDLAPGAAAPAGGVY